MTTIFLENSNTATIIHKIIAIRFIVTIPVIAAAINKQPAKFLRPLIINAPTTPSKVEKAKSQLK